MFESKTPGFLQALFFLSFGTVVFEGSLKMGVGAGLFVSVKKHKGRLLVLIGALAALALVAPLPKASAADDVIEWTRQFGTSERDYGWDTAADAAGNVYVVGVTDGVLPGGGGSPGIPDAYVTKYSSSGAFRWTRQFGSSDTDGAHGAATDPTGNLYVTGSTNDALPGGGWHDGDPLARDAYARKYDSLGTIVWTSQFGSSEHDGTISPATDSAGNLYVAGWTLGVLPGGGGSKGAEDGYLQKHNSSSGTVIWTKQFGTTSDDSALGVATDAAGNIYVAGTTYGALAGGGGSNGGADAYLSKYNSSGILQWTRQFGTADNDDAVDLGIDSAGNVYVVGSRTGLCPIDCVFKESYVKKYDSSGTLDWTRQSGDWISAAATDPAGNVYVAGNTLSGDASVRKYTSSGTILWTREFGSADPDYPMGATSDSAGNVFVAGYTDGVLPGGGGSHGLFDSFVVKFGGLPDMIVQSIETNPVSPEPGETVDVTITVKNQGAGDAAGYHVQFYKDRATPPGLIYGDEWCAKGPLAAGATDTCTVSVTYAPAGTYQMWAQVDMQDWVAESDEANNIFGPQPIWVIGVDLSVQSIVTDPVSPAPGEPVAVTVTVNNGGVNDAPAFFVDFYKDRLDPPDGGSVGDFFCNPASLAAGATYDCLGTVTYPSAGTYQMWASADIGNEVAESDEGNNILGPLGIGVEHPFLLVGTREGSGTGTVTSTPPGINCGSDCYEIYTHGTEVTLTATPNPGAMFVQWSGDCSGTDPVTTITMDRPRLCWAHFDDITPPSVPQNVIATPMGVDTIRLSWDPSTDTGGSGGPRYTIYDTRTGTMLEDAGTRTEWTFTDLATGDYSYYVVAEDFAGNTSARSRFAATRLPIRFGWQTVDIAGKTFAANPAGGTATASFVFEGDSVKVDYGCGLNTGIFEVSIDGAVVDTVDAYCSPPDFSAQKTYQTTPGGHKIVIRPMGTKNDSSSYFWTLLDGFEVAGEKYEEDDGISYTWQTVDILGATFSANPAGSTAYASFTFLAPEVRVYFGCGLNTGIFDVEIDGIKEEDIDSYCSPPNFNAEISYPLIDDSHTITIRPTGNKNTSSSYFWTLIDSFEAGGTVYQAQALPRSEAEELNIPKSRLSKLLQKLPKPLRERIEERLEKAGGIASAETLPLLNSKKLTRLLERFEGKRDEQ